LDGGRGVATLAPVVEFGVWRWAFRISKAGKLLLAHGDDVRPGRGGPRHMRIGTGFAGVVRFVEQPDVLLAVVAKAIVMNTTGRGRSRA